MKPSTQILKSSCTDRNTNCDKESEIILNNDLLMEIILRLPFKSAVRFKCVSKNWRRIISDDYFRRTLPLQMSAIYFSDDNGQDKKPRYACATDDGRFEDCDVSFFPLQEQAVVPLDGRNGLLLYRSPGTTKFYVVNPVTRRWVALPMPSKEACLSMLALDPCNSQHYRVINFTGWRKHGADLEVFSSENRQWTAHRPEFGLPTCSLSGSMHYYNGVVYILAYPDYVVCMDVVKFACTVIELPEPVGWDGRVTHSGGRLCYVNGGDDELKVWVLGEWGTCRWELKHVVRGCTASDQVRFLALDPDKMDLVYLWLPWKVVSCDLKKGELEKFWEFGKDRMHEKNCVTKIWLFPSSCYLSDCLFNGYVQR